MKIKLILSLILLSFCAPSFSAHFDENYKAYGGDINGDGLKDVYVKHEPKIIIIPFDGLNIPIVLSETNDLVDEIVLQNNGDGTFNQTAVSLLSQAERNIVSAWQTEVGSLKIADFNHDGAYDTYLDLPQSNFVGEVDDVILFSPPNGVGVPIAQTRVDAEFHEFFDQLESWVQNPNYFLQNAPIVTQVITVNDFIWIPEYCGTPGWVSENGPLDNLPPIDTVVGDTLDDIYDDSILFVADCIADGLTILHYDFVSVQYQIPIGGRDYSVFNQGALGLAQGALNDVIDIGGVIAGSSDADIIADVIEDILGTIIYGGVFRDSSIVLGDEQGLDDDVNEFRRLRWLLEQLFVIMAYLAEEGSPDEGSGSIGVPILLTFDDGPAPTSALTGIVAALGIESIKADFYVIGQQVQANPIATAALIPLGHKVQNHTWSHPGLEPTIPIPQQTQAQVNQEIGDAQNAIIAATGVSPTRFRAPYGIGGVWNRVDPKIQAAANMYDLDVIYWDVDTRDWENNQQGLNGRIIAASVLNAKAYAARNPGISRVNVLMHVQSSTAKGLLPFIEALKLAGFSFVDPPP